MTGGARSTSAGDLETVRQLLVGQELALFRERVEAELRSVEIRLAELERRLGEHHAAGADVPEGVAAQLDELSCRQEAHADRVTRMLDQVMAELTRRLDLLGGELRAQVEVLRRETADLERQKLDAADFGSALASIGRRFGAEAGGGAGTAAR